MPKCYQPQTFEMCNYDFWLQILVSEHIVENEICSLEKYMSRKCWHYGEQNPHRVLSQEDLLKGLLMSIYSHCFVGKTIILKNNYIFLSCGKLKRVRAKEECTGSAGLFTKLSSVQHKSAFFLFSWHDPVATLWLGKLQEGIFHYSNFCLHEWLHTWERKCVCERVSACLNVWAFSQQHSQNAGNLGN